MRLSHCSPLEVAGARPAVPLLGPCLVACSSAESRSQLGRDCLILHETVFVSKVERSFVVFHGHAAHVIVGVSLSFR